MALSRIRQDEEEELGDSLPYHWLKGLAQNEEEEARRRRYVAPPPPPPNGEEALARLVSVHPHGAHICYCPNCGYEQEVPENVKCNSLTCCMCGDRMRAVSTGEYRISQVEPSPIVPLLFGLGFFGLLAWAIAKKPFG